MGQVSTIGLDIAKHVFQAHGADALGAVVFRKRLRRAQVLEFLAAQPPCDVAMEACGGAHYWGREIGKLGHTVRLIPPAYVKPFVKRQKNDAADAEAICEAAQRPTMRFVAVKSEEAQAAALVFRTRDLLVRQRTQVINALRGHCAEFGIIVAKGPQHAASLAAQVEDPACGLPEAVRTSLAVLTEELHRLDERIEELDREIMQRAKADEAARRLMTIPGIGAVTATALLALAPAALSGCLKSRRAMAHGRPCTASHCSLDASLLSPDLKGFGTGSTILTGGHQVSPRTEVPIDHGVGGQEPLRLRWRFEALHLALSAPGWSMGVLRPVVQISAGAMPDIGQDLALGHAVAAQAVGDEPTRLVPEPSEQAFEKALRGTGIPPILDQDVEYDTVLVHRAPEIVQLSVDP
jgi:transposase